MKTEIQKLSACRVKLTVEASAEEIAPIYKNVRSMYTAQAKIPGFRPGKAPWATIEKAYGKDIEERIMQNVMHKLMSAAKDEGLKVASVVNVENFKAVEKEGASAEITADVHPEFTTPDVATLQVKKADLDITDDEINTRLDDVRRMAATFREATAEDEATADDLIAISFTSDLDKDALSDAAKHYAADDEYWVQIREDAFIPGLKDVLTGKKLNESIEHTATYPEDYRVTDIAGKTVKYTITLKAMRKLAPADDATVIARFGAKDMDELRASVTEHIKGSKAYAEDQRIAREICDLIEGGATFELPERILEEQIYDELSMDPSKPLESFKGTPEELRASDAYAKAKEKAVKNLHRLYVLTQFATERNVKLDATEFEAALDRLAQSAGLKRGELIKRLNDNGRMDDFLQRELATKMLSLLAKECAVL